jgi:hypothetical protein
VIKHAIVEGCDVEPQYKQVIEFVTSEIIIPQDHSDKHLDKEIRLARAKTFYST